MVCFTGFVVAYIGAAAIWCGLDSALWACVYAVLVGWLTNIVDRAVA